MTASRHPASFRDPSGFLFERDGILYRQVNESYRKSYDQMMNSGFYAEAVRRGLLIPHEELPTDSALRDSCYKVLRPLPIQFISYPYEWSFGQLADAALLTLDLQKLALEYDLWLKDASAYNVQFHEGRPLLIDTLSLEIYPEGRPWVAYQQFCKHFLAPLALMASRHVDLAKLLRVYIDGIPLEVASKLLPLRSRLSLGLIMHIHAHSRAIRTHAHGGQSAQRARSGRMKKSALMGLIDSLESTTRRLSWKPEGTEWADYYEDTNYSEAGHSHKVEWVEAFIDETNPKTVWDLGANTGRFSQIAAARGIFTVAFDVDPAAVERCYRKSRKEKGPSALPLVMDLTNPSTDLGWNGSERMSLASRGPVDLVLALALVHHLAISNNVSLPQIAEFLARLCRYLIIEFVPKEDSQVQHLLETREDIFPDYNKAGFERAFANSFRQLRAGEIRDTFRTLYLFEKK